MELQKAFKEYPAECKLVIESNDGWKLSEKNSKYQKVKTRRYLSEEDLGWLSFSWIINNLDTLKMELNHRPEDGDMLRVLLDIVADNTRVDKPKIVRKKKKK